MQSFSNPFGSQWNTSAGAGSGAPAPSVFGALPYPTSTASPTGSTRMFYLTSFNPNVLNCTVIGPQQRPVCYIVTDPQMPGYTTFKNAEGKNIALVEWQTHPLVEVRGIFSKKRVKDWLPLNALKTARMMEVSGMRCTWVPQDQHICLYTTGSSPHFLARISRGHGTITLEMTSDSMQLGLLDTALVATVLLQCGRNID